MSNVAPIKKELTAHQYRQQREALRVAYGDTKKSAGTRFEQELAKLFYVSGWTQEQLAAEEEKSPQWIAQRLKLGQFLSFAENSTTGRKTEKALFLLTERKFRDYWSETEGNDRQRFQSVIKLIELDNAPEEEGLLSIDEQVKMIVDQFADGKWHHLETITDFIGCDAGRALKKISKRKNPHYEQRKYGTSTDHRMVLGGSKKMDMAVLMKEVMPIINDLKKEGRCNMATMSPNHVFHLTDQLEKLIKKLAN